MPSIDLRADLNAEDDEGRWWALLTDAVDASVVVPGAVLIAGSERFRSVVRIAQVDPDGQVHSVALADDDPAASGYWRAAPPERTLGRTSRRGRCGRFAGPTKVVWATPRVPTTRS